jgi:N-formylglutamate amidohydrolase
VSGLTYDAGALLAAEANDRRMWALHRRALERKLVEHTNAHVPFLIGTATIVGAALVLATVRRALDAADRGEVVQPELTELDRFEHDEQLQVAAGLGTVD